VALLPLPEPYDFVVSTERYRAFGPDLANHFVDGALHRVLDGREVRIAPAPGGIAVKPLDEATAPLVLKLLGADFDLEGFYAFASAEPVLARLVTTLRGFRPPLAIDPFETLVTSISAQQVSLFAAFAVRNRYIRAFGAPVGRAYAFPTRERTALASEGDLVAVGFSRRKAEYISRGATSISTRSRFCRTRRCGRGWSRCAGSASGPPSGSSRGILRGRAPGRGATSPCRRRSPCSTATSRCARSARVSIRSRTSPRTTF
jgi:hypothetical protein